VGATRFLILSLALLLVLWSVSGFGFLRHAPRYLTYVVAAIFILSAVRIGLSVAILAFDLSPASYPIPIAFGLAAWWLRPRGPRAGTP
jgi:uncharacterized membrane protein